ncbi:hypothetical protein AgCh_029322 [Apium graveolens]
MVELSDTEVDRSEVQTDGDSIASMTFTHLQPLEKPDGRRSNCWTVFGIIDGTDVPPTSRRARCTYYKKSTYLAKSVNCTSNMNKHIKICKPYIQYLKSTGAIPQFSQTRYRELLSKAIIRHGYSFSWVEHEGNREIHTYLNHEEGLKIIDHSVEKVRKSVKYVKWSEIRKQSFETAVKHVRITETKGLWLDVPTRWNSSYMMLDRALLYLSAFVELSYADSSYKHLPNPDEWEKIQKIRDVLEPFYDITKLFSGSDYPTANLYFENVWRIAMHLRELATSDDIDLGYMGLSMKDKFEKYWSNYDVDDVHIFKNYTMIKVGHNNSTETSSSTSNPETSKRPRFNLADLDNQDSLDVAIRSKLDLYLEESRMNRDKELNILEFWGKNELKYGELSYMTRDILSVPLTRVASESSFSIGGRILNKWRSSYLPENVEVLITTHSWLHGYEVEEAECIGTEVHWSSKELIQWIIYIKLNIAIDQAKVKVRFSNSRILTGDLFIILKLDIECVHFIVTTVAIRPWNIGEFRWDSKDAEISVLLSEMDVKPFVSYADEFVCSIIPESSNPSVKYTPGGLKQKPKMNNLQITSSLSFLFVVYAKNLGMTSRVVQCEHGALTPSTLVNLAKSQVLRPVLDHENLDECAETLKLQASEQIRLVALEKAYAERVRELTRREMELAQSQFSRARQMWERAREEVDKAEKLKERAPRMIDPTCMKVICQACRQKYSLKNSLLETVKERDVREKLEGLQEYA